MPTALNHAEYRAKQAREEAAIAEQKIKILFDVHAPAPHPRKRAIHRPQDDQIDNRDGKEKEARHQRADDSANLPDGVDAML